MQCTIFSNPSFNSYCPEGYECCAARCCDNAQNYFCDYSDSVSPICRYFDERPPPLNAE
jgi:hypothetical protein